MSFTVKIYFSWKVALTIGHSGGCLPGLEVLGVRISHPAPTPVAHSDLCVTKIKIFHFRQLYRPPTALMKQALWRFFKHVPWTRSSFLAPSTSCSGSRTQSCWPPRGSMASKTTIHYELHIVSANHIKTSLIKLTWLGTIRMENFPMTLRGITVFAPGS